VEKLYVGVPRGNQVDREVFARLYEEYMPKVYRYIHYRVNSVHVAEDLTSMVFEKALVNFSKYSSDKAAFSTWIFTIARNTLTDHYRASARRPAVSLDEIVDLPNGKELPAETVERTEQATVLRKCMSRLSKEEQEIIQLKFAGELTNRQIAGMLGLTESNIGVKLFRAVRKLKDDFQEAWGSGRV
jgi:RNA polymerase sigma-70 factor (ECF subfamily)